MLDWNLGMQRSSAPTPHIFPAQTPMPRLSDLTAALEPSSPAHPMSPLSASSASIPSLLARFGNDLARPGRQCVSLTLVMTCFCWSRRCGLTQGKQSCLVGEKRLKTAHKLVVIGILRQVNHLRYHISDSKPSNFIPFPVSTSRHLSTISTPGACEQWSPMGHKLKDYSGGASLVSPACLSGDRYLDFVIPLFDLRYAGQRMLLRAASG